MNVRNYFFAFLLFSCSSEVGDLAPSRLTGKHVDVLFHQLGNPVYGNIVISHNDEKQYESYGYDLDNDSILVFESENKVITGFHTSSYIKKEVNFDAINKFTLQQIKEKYGTPFHEGYTEALFGTRVYAFFYRIQQKWLWSKFGYSDKISFQVIQFKDDVVYDAYTYDYDAP